MTKVFNEELHDFYFSPNTIMLVKSNGEGNGLNIQMYEKFTHTAMVRNLKALEDYFCVLKT